MPNEYYSDIITVFEAGEQKDQPDPQEDRPIVFFNRSRHFGDATEHFKGVQAVANWLGDNDNQKSMNWAVRVPVNRARFERLSAEWKNERDGSKSAWAMVTHPSYMKIIGMGRSALPFIFHEIANEADHWFWALHCITEEDPVPMEHHGNIEEMTLHWISWGKERGYIGSPTSRKVLPQTLRRRIPENK